MDNTSAQIMPKKYEINYFLYRLDTIQYKKALVELPRLLNISLSSLNRIRAYALDSKSSASSDQLLIIANYLNVSVDDLLNKSSILCQ